MADECNPRGRCSADWSTNWRPRWPRCSAPRARRRRPATVPTAEWLVRATASGAHTGRADRRAAARRRRARSPSRSWASTTTPDDAVVGDMLQEACNQAFAALGADRPRQGHQVRGRGAACAQAGPAPTTSSRRSSCRSATGFSPRGRCLGHGRRSRGRRAVPVAAGRRAGGRRAGAACRRRRHGGASARAVPQPRRHPRHRPAAVGAVRRDRDDARRPDAARPGLGHRPRAARRTTRSTCSSTAGWWRAARSSWWRAATASGSSKW